MMKSESIKEEEFDKNFGGDTSINTVGSYWDGRKQKLIKEKGTKIESSMTSEQYRDNIGKITLFVEKKRREWEQDTLPLEIEGRLFITPKKDYIADDEDSQGSLIPIT